MKTLARFAGVASLVLAALGPALAAPKQKLPVLLPDGFPPLGYDEEALAKVPQIESAPAVVLFEIRQQTWEDAFSRVHYYYRIKILNEDGVKEYGNYSRELYGDWRIKKTEARTVLPGGEIVDASDGVFREQSKDGFNIVRVAWPRVQVGAVLDLHLSLTANVVSIPEWVVQGYLPVLESRFVLVPPPFLSYATGVHGFPNELGQAKVQRTSHGTVHVWTFSNVPAIPRESNQPALMDIAKKLFVIPTAYRDPVTQTNSPLARSWTTLSYHLQEAWDEWSRQSSAARALAEQVATEKATASLKAEAIGRALRDRVKVEYVSDGALHDSPNEVLSSGTGTTGEIAATAMVMLRAVGVEAHLAAIRLRTSGLIPLDIPVDALFNDLLVRFRDKEREVFFSPSSDLPVGLPPWNRRGIVALPLDGKCEKPVDLPDFTATENRSTSRVGARLDGAGLLTGQSLQTFHAVAAEKWRNRLKDLDDEARREEIQDRLRRWMPGLLVSGFKIEHLDNPAEDLVIQASWEVAGYASKASSRLVINPQLLDRLSAAEWPAQERQTEIYLGGAFENAATVVLELPDGVKDVALPQAALKTAESVGTYQTKYSREGNVVTAERVMRLERYWFPAEAYEGLGRWFQDIAAADDQPLVVQLP